MKNHSLFTYGFSSRFRCLRDWKPSASCLEDRATSRWAFCLGTREEGHCNTVWVEEGPYCLFNMPTHKKQQKQQQKSTNKRKTRCQKNASVDTKLSLIKWAFPAPLTRNKLRQEERWEMVTSPPASGGHGVKPLMKQLQGADTWEGKTTEFPFNGYVNLGSTGAS